MNRRDNTAESRMGAAIAAVMIAGLVMMGVCLVVLRILLDQM